MKAPGAFAERISKSLGVDWSQYMVLVRLFSTLSDRLEFMGITAGLKKTVGFYVFISCVLSLAVLARPSLPGFLLFMIGFSMFSLLWILLMDAANSIMNPDEASVLSHQPIRGATYVAAKLTHVLVVVAVMVPALNLAPAIAGLYLDDSRWFYPVTHLMAAYLAGLFTAFFICGLYGWLFRFIPPAKLKNTSLWVQLSAFPLMLMLQQLAIVAHSGRVPFMSIFLRSSWMPWRWFVALGLTGHHAYPAFSAVEAAAACLVTLALIAIGLRAFRADYMVNVSSLLQGGEVSSDKPARRAWLGPLIQRITGAPSGYGTFAFMGIMLRRDWNFRRQAIAAILPFVLAPIPAAIASIKRSPFPGEGLSIRDFSPMHIFPHCLGMALVLVCMLIPYTAEPKGSSIFVGLPMGRLRPFVRGVYASLWMPVLVLHLCLLVPCIWFWRLGEGLLFVAFSMALVSVYIGLAILFIDGFPFANRFKPSAMSAMPVIFLVGFITAFIFSIIQWLVFHNTFLVLAAALILTVSAYAIAHVSLGKLEGKVRVNLRILGFGPSEMFKEIE
jgi:hypothetical protein